MRSFQMIMFSELGARNIHVNATENDEVVQAFLSDGLDEPLDVRHRVR